MSSMDSPEPMQVPKNSPKSQQHASSNNSKSNRSKRSNDSSFKSEFGPGVFLNIIETNSDKTKFSKKHDHATETNVTLSSTADKILMDLIKSKNETDVSLLDLITQKTASTHAPFLPVSPTYTASASNAMHVGSKKSGSKSNNRNSINLNGLLPGLNNKVLSNEGSQKTNTNPTHPKHYPKIYTAQELELNQLSQASLQTSKKTMETSKNNEAIETLATITTATPPPQNTSPVNCNDLFSLIESSSQHLDLNNNNSNAYKQLVKNLSNHPLSAPPTKLASEKANTNQMLKAAQQKKTLSTTSATASNTFESSSILKQLLNINLEGQDSQDAEKTSFANWSSTKTTSKKSSSHHSSKKSKSPKEHNNSEGFKQPKEDKFPSMNPHEKPFQGLNSLSETSKKGGKQSEATNGANTFENLILKMKQNQLNQIIEINKQEQDLKKKKVHLSNEYEHFNSLLDKIMPSLSSTMQPPSSMSTSASTSFLSHNQFNEKKSDNKNMSASASSHSILKWFDNAVRN